MKTGGSSGPGASGNRSISYSSCAGEASSTNQISLPVIGRTPSAGTCVPPPRKTWRNAWALSLPATTKTTLRAALIRGYERKSICRQLVDIIPDCPPLFLVEGLRIRKKRCRVAIRSQPQHHEIKLRDRNVSEDARNSCSYSDAARFGCSSPFIRCTRSRRTVTFDSSSR
jgi:hypothetical protein